MTDSVRPHVGIVSSSPLQRHVLQNVLTGYGLNIAVICQPDRLSDQPAERIEKVDCWVLDIDDESNDSEALDALIENAEQPILFGLGHAPNKNDERYISWERRLMAKLKEHLGHVELMDTEESIIALDTPDDEHVLQDHHAIQGVSRCVTRAPSQQIWVLAASLGGPAAVKEFLDEIPHNIKAGFLYAQHVDPHFSKVLTNVLARHSELELSDMRTGDHVSDGDVRVVPVDREVRFGAQGIEVTGNEWEGPYGPSIDHLLRNLFDYYGDRCHVIVFSGMGNDGAMFAPRMREAGCEVWTQTPESCANGSMPQFLIDLNCSTLIDTPKALAQAFVQRVGCHTTARDKAHIYTGVDAPKS